MLILLAILLSPVILGGCAYITGEAIEIPPPRQPTIDKSITPGEPAKSPTTAPSPTRWLWSAGDGVFSIIIDRQTHEEISDVSPDEAFGIIGTSSDSRNPVTIDVRTPQEYANGHIRDAINIDYHSPTFRDEISQFNKDKTYIVYCRSGNRSNSARNAMEKLGFKHVINVTGGISAWEAAGLPVVK